MKFNEVRLPDRTFLFEVRLDKDGEPCIGKTVKGDFSGMKLSTATAKATNIALKIAATENDERDLA